MDETWQMNICMLNEENDSFYCEKANAVNLQIAWGWKTYQIPIYTHGNDDGMVMVPGRLVEFWVYHMIDGQI